MDLPLISIGIPVVKANFLNEAIYCALEQTYSNIEIVILNNAKGNLIREQIENIVTSFKSEKIYYYKNETQLPIIENWNKLLTLVKGEYFSLLCDDDKWDKRFLMEIFKLTAKYPNANVFHSRALIVNDQGQHIRLTPMCNEYEDALDFIHERLKFLRAHYLSDFVVKMSAMRKIKGFTQISTGWGSDDLTWTKLAVDHGIIYTPQILFYYRESNINISNTDGLKTKISGLSQFIILLNELLVLMKPSDPDKIIQYNLILNEINVFRQKHIEMFWKKYLTIKLKSKTLSKLVFKIIRNKVTK
ncbi:glycosyltransferase [Mucilaginibacter sp.]|uniref:glycosyltransferase n=1 Tax=Mucilaginibacter sp. TaxID=1882438 RepID=UPI002840959E|nr:glycosyltransferase [Mucilaginibacter sp.]MDR3696334.1 glycosyltransferase [Mucilaginibacter sp.]